MQRERLHQLSHQNSRLDVYPRLPEPRFLFQSLFNLVTLPKFRMTSMQVYDTIIWLKIISGYTITEMKPEFSIRSVLVLVANYLLVLVANYFKRIQIVTQLLTFKKIISPMSQTGNMNYIAQELHFQQVAVTACQGWVHVMYFCLVLYYKLQLLHNFKIRMHYSHKDFKLRVLFLVNNLPPLT